MTRPLPDLDALERLIERLEYDSRRFEDLAVPDFYPEDARLIVRALRALIAAARERDEMRKALSKANRVLDGYMLHLSDNEYDALATPKEANDGL